MPELLAAAPVVNRAARVDLQLVSAALRAAGRDVDRGPPAEDLQTLVRRALAPLNAGDRARVLERLTHELDAPRAPVEATALAEALAKVARVLRERLPYVSPSGGTTLSVETLVGIDEHTYYARGLARDTEAPIVSLVAVSPEGSRCELIDRLADGTFAGCFELPVPSLLVDGWRFELRNGLGAGAEVEAPQVIHDLEEARDAVLADIGTTDIQKFHPAIERLQARLRSAVEVEAVHEFGSRDATAEISVVVPLGRRHHLLEQQLAQFAHDPDLKHVDLIYVLVSHGASTHDSVAELERLYRVPFRLVVLRSDAGEAVSADVGAELGEGTLIVLMDPDVLPMSPAWLTMLVELHGSVPDAGAVRVGAQLLDGAVLSNTTQGAACLLIPTSLFRALGGLDSSYLSGQAALSDLCLRTTEAGREVYNARQVELCRVDSSWSTGKLAAASLQYDSWLLSRRWARETQDKEP